MLPRSWKRVTVEESCSVVSVGIVVNPSHYYVEEHEGIKAFRSQNVRENRVNEQNWVYISAEGQKKNSKSILKSGDVVVVRTGFAGTACVVPSHLEGSNCIDILFARPMSEQLLPEYLCELTNSDPGRRQVLNGQSGLAQKHLNVSAYEKLSFPLPPIAEQRKLIELFNTWNEAIATTDNLLANSRRQKKVLMQQLLTGKRRLQKFVISNARVTTRFGSIPADWRHVPIERVAREFSVKNGSDRQLPVLSCTKHAGLVDSLSYFNKQVFSQDVSTYKLVERGCFAYATNHIDEGSIGYQNLYDKALISPMYTVFKPGNEIDHGFLFKLLKTEHYRQIFAANTNASVDRRGSLRWGDFKKIEIPLPSMAEQVAISGIIDSVQLEIESFEKQLDRLKAEKRALMQQLLTGKRRVRFPASEAASA